VRRYSLKRQKLNRRADEWRRQRIEEIGVCDICAERPCELIHEISRGQNRELSLMAAYAQLGPCSQCHDLKIHKGMTVAMQLAYLFWRRPAESDIVAFWNLTDRRWPSCEEIWTAYVALTDYPRNP